MTIEDGLALYRAGDFTAAADNFQSVVEQDGDNHVAWNALGICLSKKGDFENANTCFENALMINPGNVTYENNLAKNAQKLPNKPPNIPNKPPDSQKPKPPEAQQRVEREYDYHRNWLQIPLFFVPIFAFIINIGLGLVVLALCAWYIKYDADNLNAGSNPNGSVWGKMKGWEWAVLLFLFWILLPLYAWKRETVYRDNLGYGQQQSISGTSPVLKAVVAVIGLILLSTIVAAFVFGMSGSVSQTQTSHATTVPTILQPEPTIERIETIPVQTKVVTVAPTTKPIVEQKQNSVTLAEKNAAKKALDYLTFSHFSRSGLIKQLEFEGFTNAESVYGVDQTGANWNDQAALKAEDYLEFQSFSRDGLINQLEFEGFTQSQAEYGVKSVGY